jgi:hypothetical protein
MCENQFGSGDRLCVVNCVWKRFRTLGLQRQRLRFTKIGYALFPAESTAARASGRSCTDAVCTNPPSVTELPMSSGSPVGSVKSVLRRFQPVNASTRPSTRPCIRYEQLPREPVRLIQRNRRMGASEGAGNGMAWGLVR